MTASRKNSAAALAYGALTAAVYVVLTLVFEPIFTQNGLL